MKFFTALISDSIKERITNTTVRASVRCSTGKRNTIFRHLSPIARQVYRRLVCFFSLVALYSLLLGPVLAQIPEYAPSGKTDFREWEGLDAGRSILDRYERFRPEAETRGILKDKFYGEMPVAAISVAKPVVHTGMNICDRTAVVMNAILSKIPGTNDCAEITSTQLAAITGTLSLNSKNIPSLKAGDFDGLISLTSLNLWRNNLATIPEGIFDELTSLTSLDLSENALVSLPDRIFDELSSLDVLGLGKNDLVSLPDSIFDELSSLEGLYLNGNNLSTLPDDIFDPLTSLRVLDLERNYLATLPDGIFDGLTSLDVLGLGGNDLHTLPGGIFDELSSLGGLILYGNGLVTLPEDIFDELTSLTSLDLWRNNLVSLPDGIFDEPTSLTWLFLDGNALVTLPKGIFDELTLLTWLGLGNNDLSILPDGIFDELTSLTELRLCGNDLSALPDGIFEDLTELYSSNSVGLRLQGNPGAPFRPVVNASVDLTVQPGTEVSIPGSVTGPWGSFVRWTWIQVDGPDSDTPVSGALPLTGGDTAMPSFTAPMTEVELHFRLVATPGHEGTPPEANGYAISDPDWITVRLDVATNVTEVPLVVDFELLGNYPNPFNPTTTILVDLPETAAVSVDIFNMLGQRIHREDIPTVAAGPSQPLPLKLSHLPSGVYVYQVTAQMRKEIHYASGRMTLIK